MSVMKWIVRILLVFLLYVIAGALLPFAFPKKVSQDYSSKVDPSAFYGTGTGVDRAAIVETNKEALDVRIQMIQEAKERIILTTFDIRPGDSCNDVFAALLAAADRGVKVQVMVDGLYGTVHMSGDPLFYAAGSHPNFEIKFYNVPNLLMPWTANGRMHDKYVIVDDKLLLAGGRNTFDYFLGENQTSNPSYDREVLIYNTAYEDAANRESVLFEVKDYFDALWEEDACQYVFDSVPGRLKAKTESSAEWLRSHYQEMADQQRELFVESFDYEAVTMETHKISFIHNPTHIMAKEPYVWYELEQLMKQAKSGVYIQTPYAVFSKDMYQGMKDIDRAVGQFSMQVNSVAVGDNFMASSDYVHNRGKILDTGVDLYEFQGDHSSHGKSILVDDDIAVIGSFNLDMRSVYIDTEVMFVIHSEEINRDLNGKIAAMHVQALKVGQDGNYEENPDVPAVQLPGPKKFLFGITSWVFQLFRYLI